MSKIQTSTTMLSNFTHEATVALNEGVRQTAVAGAAQTAAKTAEITFYRACLASAQTNSCSAGTFLAALRELGVGS